MNNSLRSILLFGFMCNHVKITHWGT